MNEYEHTFSTEDLEMRLRQQLQYLNFSWFNGDESLAVGWMTLPQVQNLIGALADLETEGKGVFEMGGWGEHEKSTLTFERMEDGRIRLVEGYPGFFDTRAEVADIQELSAYLEGKQFDMGNYSGE